jgi:hypothetical protein
MARRSGDATPRGADAWPEAAAMTEQPAWWDEAADAESALAEEQADSGGPPGAVRAALSGLAGALTVTALNEIGRRVAPHTPRLEVMGERGLSAAMRVAGAEPPKGRALFRWTMLGDLASNTSYYSMVSGMFPRRPWLGGALLGVAAGVGAVALPKPLGLGRQPGERTPITQLLTVAWYTAGGLAAAGVSQALGAGRRDGEV